MYRRAHFCATAAVAIGLPAHPGGPQLVDAQPGGDRGQKRLGGLAGRSVRWCPVVPDEGLLHDVLGVNDAIERPRGDRDQQRAKLLDIVRVGAHRLLLTYWLLTSSS